MKKLLLLLIVFLQSCATSSYVLKEYKRNPSLYYVTTYSVQDNRVYDKYPNIMCQLDKCSLEEFTDALNGYMLLERNQVKNPLLITSITQIIGNEIRNNLKGSEGAPTTISIKLSCIGYGSGGLQITVYGEITDKTDIVIWKGSGVSMSAYQVDDFNEIDWNAQITEGIKDAVRNCISHIPGY